jgi:predicted aspartyl protease
MSVPFSSQRYEPSIPVLHVRFHRLDGGAQTEKMEAIVDTGADMTIAPAHLLDDLGVEGVVDTEILTQWHEPHSVTLYLIDLDIEGLRLSGVYVAGDQTADEIVLGRNVLNKLTIFFDGPKQQTEILDDPTVKRLRDRRE